MHRKFIALIIALSMAVTGLSAVPARADTQGVVAALAGIAAFAMIGAAIHNSQNRPDPVVIQPQTPTYGYTPNNPKPPHNPHHPHRPTPPRPQASQFDLPAQCLRDMRSFSGQQLYFGNHCLQSNYRHVNSLPRSCQIQYWDGQIRANRGGYSASCLRSRGYRVAGR